MNRKAVYIIAFLCVHFIAWHTAAQKLYHEQYRNQVHFSPKAHWMNDPNGMVYNDGIYHLLFQYYPGSTVWGRFDFLKSPLMRQLLFTYAMFKNSSHVPAQLFLSACGTFR